MAYSTEFTVFVYCTMIAHYGMCLCVCVVCVRERERDKDRERVCNSMLNRDH